MRLIGSRKSLLFKTAGIGLIITLVSLILLFIDDLNTKREIQQMVNGESRIYLKSVQGTISALIDNVSDHSIAAHRQNRNLSKNEELAQISRQLENEGFSGVILAQINPRDITFSCPVGPDSIFRETINQFYKADQGYGVVGVENEIYAAVTRSLDDSKRNDLVLLFPLKPLYDIADRDHRINMLFYGPKSYPEDSNFGASVNLVSFDGKQIGSFEIKARKGMPRERDLSGWTVLILGFMPFLGFVLVSYLLYRYFESFADHSAAICRILQRNKPGVEIFRRDQQLVKNDMPELSDIFNLIEENQSEKARLQRSLDVLSASLGIIKEKGNDENTVGEVIEFLVNAAGFFGGAVFTLDRGDDRVKDVAKFNFSEVLMSGLSQTTAGLSFIKDAQERGTSLIFSCEDLPDESWRRLFEGFRHVAAIPLHFKSKSEGLLLLTSLEPISDAGIPVHILNIIGSLLANQVHGIGIEHEKLARYNKAMILQEISLAISSNLDLPSVLKEVASHLTDYADATYCMILLNSDFENSVEMASFYTRRLQGTGSISESVRINIAELPSVREALTSNRALILGSPELDDMTGMERSLFHVATIKLLTILPISHSAKSIGAVVLGEERGRPRATVAPDKLSFVQAIVSQAASAIENARLYEFINNKVDQLSTLYSAGAVIHSEIELRAMLEKVLAAIHDYLNYSIAAVFLQDETDGKLQLIAINGVGLSQGTEKILVGTAHSLSENAASSGASQLIDDFRVESEIRPSFRGLLSELSVPVKLGERILGVITIGSLDKQAFTEVHENFLKTLAAQIAVAMERTRLFEQERERGIRLNSIFEFSKKISKSLNIQEVITAAANSILEAFSHELVVVFLPDQIKHCFSIGYQVSSNSKQLPDGFSVAESSGLLGKAISSRKTVHCGDVNSYPDYVIGVEDIKSEVCIPIIQGDNIMGILDVESTEIDGFTPEDISTLEALADIMAVAMNNSYLFEETIQKAERLSLIDNINKAISATLDLDSFFRVVARAVSDNAGYRWTGLVVPDGDSFIFKAGYTPKSVGVISTENILDILHIKLASVINQSTPEFLAFSDLAALGAPERLQSVVDAGIRNIVLYPIGDNIRAEAVMIVGSSRADGFSSQELLLLKDLAVHLRIAWQNAQLYRQLKTAYEQLQEAQERVVQTEKLRALGEMSSGVVHDFNNVLAAIIGRLQIISRKISNYEDWSGTQFLNRNLELIEKAANDGTHILSRIREFTGKKQAEKFIEVQIDQIINDTIELTKPRWHDKALARGRTIDVQFRHDGKLRTTGNPTELREVFTNLINNSIDAITGDGKITIDAARTSQKEIVIDLQDNGSGMTSETRKKIFEPFFTTKGVKGTGLGLSVTYGIISRHKGTIEVESEPGRGTRFTIRMPIREAVVEQPRELGVIPKTSRNILVVDDEESFREVITEILVSGGHLVDSCPDADSALELLKRREYDLVITDLGMSGMSGWELADRIHKLYPDIRVIMATGWGTDLDQENLTAHHVNGLIGKPFKVDEIMRIVDVVLIQSREEVFVEQG